MNNIVTMFKVPVRRFCLCVPRWHPQPDYGPMEVQRSELLNGMKVAAAKHLGSQISACTVMYQAGSRYECGDYLGANHFLRAMSSAAGQGCSAFSKMRVLHQNGAYLTCSSDRQSIAFTLRCTLPKFTDLKYYLLDTAARCCYNDWDIDDRRPLVLGDLYRITPEQRVIDLVQRALWRGPLGNSIFCEEARVDEMNMEKLCCFARTNFTSDGCTVASFGVPFDETMKLAVKLEEKRDKPTPRPMTKSCPRNGFEYFDLGRDHDTWIAVAVPGCGSRDVANLVKHAIVAAACGTGDLNSGQHSLDRTPQPPLGLMAGTDVYTNYRAFNISYSDTGTFGIVAKTRACTARNVARCVVEFLAHVGDLDFKQIENGKKRLKVGLYLHGEDCVKVTEGLALQLANNVQLESAQHAACMVETLCPDEIISAAKSLSSKACQMAIAVVGDVTAVPHDRELLCGQYGF